MAMTMFSTVSSASTKDAYQARATQTEVLNLINQYSSYPGFEIVKVGSLGTSLLKKLIISSIDKSDKEERQLLDIIKGVKKLAIVDYSDSDAGTRQKFVSKVEKILGKDNLIMSVKDDGETMNIYGVVSEDGSKLSNFILHTPSSDALICLFGTIPIDSIVTLID